MAIKKRFIVQGTIAALLVSAALLAGLMMTNASSDLWTDHAETDWYDPTYDTFTIDSEAKLAGVAKLVNEGRDQHDNPIDGFSGMILQIDSHFDLSAYQWVPIGTESNPFKGTFITKGGQNFIIDGMRLEGDLQYAGLIGKAQNSTVGGFTLGSSGSYNIRSTSGNVYAGSAVGQTLGLSTVFDVTNELAEINVEVDSDGSVAYVGGIVGYGEGNIATVVNQADIAVAGHAAAGGIIGATAPSGAQLKIKMASNSGAITVTGTGASEAIAGGIAGYAQAGLDMSDDDTIISNSAAVTINDGDINYAGGIVGKSAASVYFSRYTSNNEAISIDAPASSGSYAGGLLGAIIGMHGELQQTAGFENSGSITNNGGSNVHTGGIAGLLESSVSWELGLQNKVPIVATGIEHVFTGGLVGKTSEDLYFNGSAINSGSITVSASTEADNLDDAYTGGLIGYAEKKVFLESEEDSAYANGGQLQIAGNNDIYTGGIIANRAYSRSNGIADNVSSTGNIEVIGEESLFTGGYIGSLSTVSHEIEQNLTGAAYAGRITVHAAADANRMVATGGIIGLYQASSDVAELSALSFSGQLDVESSDHTYTGGIVGYARKANLVDSQVGGIADAHATIAADGVLGGVAGYVNGSIEDAEVKHVTLIARSSGAFAGGIAGQAAGSIANADVGDAEAKAGVVDSEQPETNSVIFVTDIEEDSTAAQQLTAGGIIGSNTAELHIAGSTVNWITLLTEAEQSQYRFGGIAGELSELGSAGDATQAGDTTQSLQVNDLTIVLYASDSQVGGAIGVNEASHLYIDTNNITIEARGSDSAIGGVIGSNEGAIALDTAKIYAGSPKLIASVAPVALGGIAGENNGELVESTSENAVITVAAPDNPAGGIVGYHTNKLINVKAINAAITLVAEGGLAGGIVGHSAGTQAGTELVSIENATVEQREAPLLTTVAPNTKIGGIVGLAQHTEIINPTVAAAAPSVVLIAANAEGPIEQTMAGGIAGHMQDSVATGIANQVSVRNIAINFAQSAEAAYAGGLAGYAEATQLEDLTVHTAIITINGVNNVIGGAVGHYHSSEDAAISGVLLSTITLRAQASAEEAIIGGVVGVNAKRDSDPMNTPDNAASTIKNTRIIGNLSNPNSPFIDSRGPEAIVGGIVGTNSSFVANVSLIDQNVISVSGRDSVVGGHTAINKSDGVIYNTYANAKLTVTGAHTTTGGLIGSNEGAIIGSYVDTAVSNQSAGSTSAWAPLGGLVGSNRGAIERSYVQSNVTASGAYAVVGGLVGLQLAGTIDNSYAGGKVHASVKSAYAGGFAGRIAGGNITHSYSAMNVSAATSAHAGGFAGRYESTNKELLYKNYYIKDEAVNLNKDLPDFAEGNYRWLNVPARLSTVLDSTLKDRVEFPELSGWNFDDIWRYGSPNAKYLYPELVRVLNDGGGDQEHNVNANVAWYTLDPNKVIYEIRTEAELSGLAAIVNGTIPGIDQFGFAGRTIRIMNPIHIQSEEWIPIGKSEEHPFQGTFNGNNHLIDGYRMAKGTATAGLFGYIGKQADTAQALVENVKLEPLAIAGAEYAGALAAVNHGKVSNVKLHLTEEASIRGQFVGGLIGKNTGDLTNIELTSEENTAIEGNIEGAIVGSLLGINETNIATSNSISNNYIGKVLGSSNNTVVGGWIGSQSGSIADLTEQLNYELLASGEDNIAGGFIGHYEQGALENIALTLTDSKLTATSAASILGGVVGRSAAGQVISNVSVTSEATTESFIQGNGIVGGVIGSKTGSTGEHWDVETISYSGGAVVGSHADSVDSIIGGIIGQLNTAAATDASFAGQLAPLSEQTTVGGIVGISIDSVLVDVEAMPTISFEAAQNTDSVLGGIVGELRASNTDDSYSLGHAIPLYIGIYKASVHDAIIEAIGENNRAGVTIGGIAGRNEAASIYFSDAAAKLSAEGFLSARVGGVAGESSGIIIETSSSPSITADHNTLSWIGGIVGLAEGGAIHYTHALAPAEQSIAVSNLVTANPELPEAYVGGFVGIANEVEMSRVFSELDVTVNSSNPEDAIYAGGFAGALGINHQLDSARLQWAYALGDVSVTGKSISFAGGFGGVIDRYDVSHSYAEGVVQAAGHDMRSGGFAAAVDRRALITDSNALQNKLQVIGVTGTTRAYVGGFAAYNEGSLENVYAHAQEMNGVTGANTYQGGLVGYLFSGGSVIDSAYRFNGQATGYSLGESSNLVQEDRSGAISLADWELLTDATILLNVTGDELVVYNPVQINSSVLLTNDSTGHNYFKLFKRDVAANTKLEADTKLGADIDLTNWSWKPYESFDLVFDGQGYSITGLTLADSTAAQAGFMYENSGTVQNVSFIQAKITAGDLAKAAVVVGTNLATGIVSNVEVKEAAITGGAVTGAIVGENKGSIADVIVEATVSGSDSVGGVAGVNAGSIEAAAVNATVQGNEFVGGVAGTNEDSIADTTVAATVSGGEYVGGIAGINAANARIEGANAAGFVTGAVEAGGLTGTNVGSISNSYAANIVSAPIAGGITGTHAAEADLDQVFTFGTVTSDAETAVAGGIAGVTSGAISNSYAAAIVKATGSEQAQAGGIAGYAQAGQLTAVINFGEVSATVQGKIAKGKSFVGGIAGQKLAAATIQTAAFNKQMLQADTAYYNENGVRISGAATGFGLTAKALTSGELPFDNSNWQAVEGFFPQLRQFAGTEASTEEVEATTVSTAAILLGENNSLHDEVEEFKASYDAELTWSASKAQFAIEDHEVIGQVTNEGIVDIVVSGEQLSKTIRINVPHPGYEHKAAAPSFVNEPEQFEESVLVELTAADEGAEMYYTLDNTAPTAQSLHYTAPIELTKTTTIRAITAVDDMEISDELVGLWSKKSVSTGGGGIFIPMEPMEPEQELIPVFLGDKELPMTSASRATVARNSKLVLAVPDDVVVYYTTDGSTPTENSPIYSGELLITRNLQIKYMTNKDERVVTLNYTVAPAQFSVKEDAANLTYINSYNNNTFAPNQAITREELVRGLFELLDIEDVPLGTLLTDVEGEQADLVAKFESAGLVEGYTDGTFRGENGLTRAEFVTIVTRILKLKASSGANGSFADVKGHWASQSINAVAAAGYIKGYPDGTFKPEQKITRAEAVVLINRIFGIKAKASVHQDFSDVSPKHWAYEDIMKAAK